ncbi:hypothetical protein GCM10007385_35630 [Tateyamaria omphalii]|uniref:hypothetical protein n=1 Tax=Tateyamaria omphalii TaxID=299262 RepID=UPI001677E31A|nr:hypothetical protein [Tateyamaria omphalii]GGX63368.1 hypothetical protein GCM10007385_35630 [Tateyamaria omphalii]
MNYAPLVRISLRYGAGALFSVSVGDMLASDPDVVNTASAALSFVITAVTEWLYARAKREGGAT